ncbi:GDH/6PGL endoplasmic bifunctional protein [Lepisosteus oculatus]|uniref:GDH/6PGL endoplasmic bifunctional protein n=1 Tax=Lepisosteus oculatus TaxID=7918 RepID=UPI00371172EE
MMWPALWALLLVGGTRPGRGWAKEVDGGREDRGHVSVVVVGATGDLARKYLWQGFFQLYADEVGGGHSFSFYGAALSDPEKGSPALFAILRGLACPALVSPERCAALRDQFLKLARYRQLKSEQDYAGLHAEIGQGLQPEGPREAGRLFYLSVPAFAYADIAGKINGSCRPPAGAWLRVVLEKPFGHDSDSASLLSSQLEKFLKEEETYRIDHYLGKQVVAQILPFRMQNRKLLSPIWNRHHVERVEIVLKETLDVKGRTEFYNQYGVIRDVIQNHLTEVLTLLTTEIPVNLSSSGEILRNKLRVFSSLLPLDRGSAVIGQYQAYSAEVREELNKTKDFVSAMPTFAGVAVHIGNSQFDGVPFILTSGKLLDERVGYARVLFKNRVFCVQNVGDVHCQPRQIVFYFGHGSLQNPAILVSKNLFKPVLPEDSWQEVTEHKDISLFGLPLSQYYVQTPRVQKEAYAVLISHIFHAKKDSFISTENLLASWQFWTPLLHSLAQEFPRLYPGGEDNKNLLDFKLQGREVSFTNEAVVLISQSPGGSTAQSFQVTQGKYRTWDMVSAWAEELIHRLASDLQGAAERAVRRRGQFHLALSGGSSPLALFQRLALHHYAFPWERTHVWMVDERCVPLWEQGSNFRTVHDHLLQHVRMPYFNIHPMPVHLNQRLCVEEDGGPQAYEKEIARFVNDSSFDYVLLGVGYDGHTASLFKDTKAEALKDKLVALTESPVKPHQRMSLTFSAINRARAIGVLAMGKGKHEMITQLSRVKDDPRRWPITGVKPVKGRLVWYIDYEALLG